MTMLFGVLAINKPSGPTSRFVVNRVLRAIGKPKVKAGHTGTLDPMASGVLLVAIGRATRLVEDSHSCTKKYIGKFLLGRRSDTLDAEGQVEELVNSPRPSHAELESAASRFAGHIKQVPPKFSAIRIAGRRAYDLARDGKDFEVPSRDVFIADLRLSGFDYPEFRLDVECGTGTYIRTLGDDVARACGTEAIMTSLVRTEVGGISIKECCELEELTDRDAVAARLLPPLRLIPHLPKMVATAHQVNQVMHGRPLSFECQHDRVAMVDAAGDLIATVDCTGAQPRSLNVFCSTNDTAQPSKTSTPHNAES